MKIKLAMCLAASLSSFGFAWGQEQAKSPTILDDPLDFSRPPQLPVIEPASEGVIQSAIDRGVRFLIEDQNKNGSWGSATRTKGLNIYAPVPGPTTPFAPRPRRFALPALIELDSELPGQPPRSTVARPGCWNIWNRCVAPVATRSTTSGATATRFKLWSECISVTRMTLSCRHELWS